MSAGIISSQESRTMSPTLTSFQRHLTYRLRPLQSKQKMFPSIVHLVIKIGFIRCSLQVFLPLTLGSGEQKVSRTTAHQTPLGFSDKIECMNCQKVGVAFFCNRYIAALCASPAESAKSL